MRFRSRDLRNDRIAKRSSRGSRYVDYIVLTGGSSARRCTKASTTLAHISPCFHLPTHSLCLSLSLSSSIHSVLLFSYTPFRQCYRLSSFVFGRSSSVALLRTIYQRSARFTLRIPCPLCRRSFPYLRSPPFRLGLPKHLFLLRTR